ncbi:hypothetical protein LPJ73_000646 [Coemansia sp. RSA 2703]|nr:hypothetical protein LPJ73_000646 [Coemansia sp. RSA 2703]KAJ2398185.1 hypothetical protein GGI05_000241 [Coemansia sp. RSA 2603]
MELLDERKLYKALGRDYLFYRAQSSTSVVVIHGDCTTVLYGWKAEIYKEYKSFPFRISEHMYVIFDGTGISCAINAGDPSAIQIMEGPVAQEILDASNMIDWNRYAQSKPSFSRNSNNVVEAVVFVYNYEIVMLEGQTAIDFEQSYQTNTLMQHPNT